MFQPIKIAPSILSANFMSLKDEVDLITEAGADYIHVDVMDGHFVPNLTMGIPLVKQLAPYAKIPLDVHLMIANPEVQVPWFMAKMCEAMGVSPLIQVDGGIGVRTAPAVASGGADVLVCGNAVFKAEDPAAAISEVRAVADAARLRALESQGAQR